MQRISVFGLGYVGSVTAACLAKAGHKVIGVDTNTDKVEMVNGGRSPIIEPGLESLLDDMVREGALSATANCSEAIAGSDIALVCVGTPGDRNGQLGMDAIVRVAEQIGEALADRQSPFTLVIRSTVLPGTIMEQIYPRVLDAAGAGPARVKCAANPEFMREGTAIADFFSPPFTLIGANEKETAALLRGLYAGVNARVVETGVETAELVKYASNAYHALKICFANEVADICEAFGADAREVMRIFSMDTKLNVSSAYLRPGFAFGGSCLPKDLKALLYAARHADLPVPLLGSILPSNERQVARAVEQVLATGKRRIGVVGLSFKPATDDLRESPMVALVEALIGKGCHVRVLDSNVRLSALIGANKRFIEEEIPHIATLMCEKPETLMDHAEVLVFGNSTDEAITVHRKSSPNQIHVDLTRGEIVAKASAESRAA